MSRVVNDCGCGNKARKTCAENCKNNNLGANRGIENRQRGSENSNYGNIVGCGCVAQPLGEKANVARQLINLENKVNLISVGQ